MHTPYLLKKSDSSAIRSALISIAAAPFKSMDTTHPYTAITIYAAIEFLAVANSAYFIGFFYHGGFLNSWKTDPKYILAAAFIATLVLLTSFGFHSVVAIRRQPRHMSLWRGAEAVVLEFSIFLSIIFIAPRVLRNEMSIIGPRPHAGCSRLSVSIARSRRFTGGTTLGLGITGCAQVHLGIKHQSSFANNGEKRCELL